MVSKKSRPRRSAEETRRVLVAEGIRQIESAGLEFGVEHLTLETACVLANVPRSSSHAAWASSEQYAPQALFQRAVLEAWLTGQEGFSETEAIEAGVAAGVKAHGGSNINGVARLAAQAVLEVALRAAGDGERGGLLSSDMAIKHTLASQPVDARDPEIAEWVRWSEQNNLANRIENLFRPLLKLTGMQPRAEYGDDALHHVAVAVRSLVEGITLRDLISPEAGYATKSVRSTPTGQPGVTLLGACVEALVDKFFEPAN